MNSLHPSSLLELAQLQYGAKPPEIRPCSHKTKATRAHMVRVQIRVTDRSRFLFVLCVSRLRALCLCMCAAAPERD